MKIENCAPRIVPLRQRDCAGAPGTRAGPLSWDLPASPIFFGAKTRLPLNLGAGPTPGVHRKENVCFIFSLLKILEELAWFAFVGCILKDRKGNQGRWIQRFLKTKPLGNNGDSGVPSLQGAHFLVVGPQEVRHFLTERTWKKKSSKIMAKTWTQRNSRGFKHGLCSHLETGRQWAALCAKTECCTSLCWMTREQHGQTGSGLAFFWLAEFEGLAGVSLPKVALFGFVEFEGKPKS